MVSDREGRSGVRRRLAAVFAADVAGYSRLVGRDESGTLLALRKARKILDALIEEHSGRVANTAGDSVLAEFPSAIDAVQCASAAQRALLQTEGDRPLSEPLRFRMAVHMAILCPMAGICWVTALMFARGRRNWPNRVGFASRVPFMSRSAKPCRSSFEI